jgi:hypothetical protein
VTIQAFQAVLLRKFSGWLDHRYPEGMWYVRGEVTGDASGGDRQIFCAFQFAAEAPLSGRMFSLEQAFVNDANSVDKVVRLRTSNMDDFQGSTMTNNMPVSLLATEGGSACWSGADFMPIWLGSAAAAATDVLLTLDADNVDTAAIRLMAQGYYWSPRSVLIDGGPQRPPRGMFPT